MIYEISGHVLENHALLQSSLIKVTLYQDVSVSHVSVKWVSFSSHWHLGKIFTGNKMLQIFQLQCKYIWVQLTSRVECI